MKGGENKKTKGTLYKLCAVQARMCSMNQAHLQYKQGRSEKYSAMNEALILLIYQVQMVSNLWQAAKIN